MNDLLSKLTGTQALEVLGRLASTKGAVADAILAEAERVLAVVDIEGVAEDVFLALDMIDVEDCWDRAGDHFDGYTSPDEAAEELIEAALQPFQDQVERYSELGMVEQERDYCMGIVLGAYRYEKESKSEFKNWCEDLLLYSVRRLLDEWRERTADTAMCNTMDEFIRGRCSGWMD